jgi:hypothetical protein
VLSSSAVAGLAAVFCGWALLPASGWAGEARVVDMNGSERIVIETSDASLDEVLAALATHFEFAVERNFPPGQAIRFSGRLHGSLDQLLDRLLRHEAHIVVRSAEARAGVSRVVLLQSKGVASVRSKGAEPEPTVRDGFAALSAGFPLKAKRLLPQLWAGQE